jgi:hypothetical protein
MNIVFGALIVVVACAVTISAMLLVRRRAPEGSYFSDGDRASGVFGVLATGFALLLGFMIFLAFESYDASRSGAETEATLVAQQVQTAQFLPRATATELTGELVCYGRSVAGIEWDAVDSATLRDQVNPWGRRCFTRSGRSNHRPPPSSRPTTGGWTRPPSGSKHGLPVSTVQRESSRYRCGSPSSLSPG